MAEIIVENTGHKGEITDGDQVKDKCEELGIIFGCKDGLCGTCKVKVIEGMENLSEKNEKEVDFGLEDNERLMCQAKIKHGTVKVDQSS